MIELIALFCSLVLVGLYYENRGRTDALVRIAKALEE